MNRTILFLIFALACTLQTLPALTPDEQVNAFLARGQSAEARGELVCARLCYELALRARPGHQAASAGLERLYNRPEVRAIEERTARAGLQNIFLHGLRYRREIAGSLTDVCALLNTMMPSGGADEIAGLARILQIEVDQKSFPGSQLADLPPLRIPVPLQTRGTSQVVVLEDVLQRVTQASGTAYRRDGLRIIIHAKSGGNPVPASITSNPPASPPPPAQSAVARPTSNAPLVWKSKDGRSVEGEFVGLDGEAVVIKRDGKEFTIPFTRLDPASVKQAKDLANPVVPGVPTAVEDPFAAAAKENPIPPTTPIAPNGSAAPVTAGFPAPKHRWSFGGDLRDSLGGAHGTLVDPGEPTARFVDGKLDLSANRGDPSRAPTNDAYVDLPNGLVKGVGGKLTFEAWVQPTKNLVRACIFRFEVATVEGLGAHHAGGSGPVPPEYRAIFLIPHDQDGDLLGRLAHGNRVQDADTGTDLPGEGERHFAMVLDPGDPGARPAGSMKLYLDGKLAASTRLFAGFLESFNDNNCWLGRGFAGNPFFSGIYNEFRIYDKALSAEQVLASFRAGPDAVMPAAGPGVPE